MQVWCKIVNLQNLSTRFMSLQINLHNKRRYVCLSVCMLPMAGRTAGSIKTKLGVGSVLVKIKVKVIYPCVRYNRIHDSDTWRTTMKHVRNSSSSSSIKLIKLLT